MFPNTFSVFGCPFCPSQNGQIHVDVDAIRRHEVGDEIDINVHLSQQVIRFDPPRGDRAPCDHILTFRLEVDLMLSEVDSGDEEYGVTALYHHPGFSSEPDSEMLVFHFYDVLDRQIREPYFVPESSFEVRDIEIGYQEKEHHSYSPHAKIDLSGWVVVAANPQQVFEELRFLDELEKYALAYRENLRTNGHAQELLEQSRAKA